MPKELRGIQFNITGIPNLDGSWSVLTSATLNIGLAEYPEFSRSKGIPIVLTDAQKATIRKFVETVVIPQSTQNI